MPKITNDLEVSDEWVMGVTAGQANFIAENVGGNPVTVRYQAAQPTTNWGHVVAHYVPGQPREERVAGDDANDENVWFRGLGGKVTTLVISNG